MSRYRITLKPIGSFFFSSEKSFKYIGDEEENINYFSRSNRFPQQTSILGMMRKEILKIKELYSEDWNYSKKVEEVNKYIGKSGFSITKNNDFGVIKEISPVFIKRGQDILMNIPKDYNNDYAEYMPFEFGLKVKDINGKEINILSNFIAKNYNENYFLNLTNGNIIDKDAVFTEDTQIGITRDNEGKTKENAFYKIIKYRLESEKKDKNMLINYFVLDAEIDNCIKIDDDYTNIVSLGGEKSLFNIKIEKIDDRIENIVENHLKKIHDNIVNDNYLNSRKYNYKVICISDVYTDKELLENNDYAIREYCDFRYRVESNNKINKNNYKKGFASYGSRFSFIERGSVIFTNNVENILNKINSHKNLCKIGYNKVVVIKEGNKNE
ncbi:type III-B CRISPR module-associated Cmr3 family protein [Abyssisolibacter fermentans]|uniref:type III-B CRISPR module-associated Cmr3 family protein n=1 Tax=Abyssisolibacter fermentans TaxID=1766203 RepID=UPI00082B7467|nr:type III-B CRISPR module-associated Cmr3 family protein [Abyssisolibacter fermentans]